MRDFNMYNLFKIRVKYNYIAKNANNLTYMYARDIILYSFERKNKAYPMIKNYMD